MPSVRDTRRATPTSPLRAWAISGRFAWLSISLGREARVGEHGPVRRHDREAQIGAGHQLARELVGRRRGLRGDERRGLRDGREVALLLADGRSSERPVQRPQPCAAKHRGDEQIAEDQPREERAGEVGRARHRSAAFSALDTGSKR